MPQLCRLLWLTLVCLSIALYFLPINQELQDLTAEYVTIFSRKPHVRLLGHIPKHLVPTPKNGRRLIVVGDIHGMLDPLNELLDTVGYDEARDHLVATGDMISKGPDSKGVVNRLRELGASAVRGNHEDHILKARWKMDRRKRRKKHNKLEVNEEDDEDDDFSEYVNEKGEEMSEERKVEIAKHKQRDRQVAKSLSKEQVRWLNKRPAILSAEPLPIYIVHAGLVPGIQVKEQDAWAVMNMRSIIFPKNLFATASDAPQDNDDSPRDFANLEPFDDATPGNQQQPLDSKNKDILTPQEVNATLTRGKHLIPDDGHHGKSWANVWNKYQHHKPAKKRKTVVYGHDARRGHMVGDYTFGLDSACVKGGSLTAVVITGKKGGWDHEVVQVACKKP